MKKGTIIVLVISIVYCGLATYQLLFSIGSNGHFLDSILPNYLIDFLIPGYILGFVLGYSSGEIALWIGQIITFLILFFLLKSVTNWVITKVQKLKN